MNNQNNNKKLSKVLSTKLSIDDYNAFLTLTKLEYQTGLIKEESTSELLRFTIRHILNQVRNQPEYQNTRTIGSSKPAAAVKHRIK